LAEYTFLYLLYIISQLKTCKLSPSPIYTPSNDVNEYGYPYRAYVLSVLMGYNIWVEFGLHEYLIYPFYCLLVDFFRSDLTEARNRLHEAFSGIYGYNYKVNHAFFFQFFNDLEAYMAGRRGDLGQLVTSFFAQLRTSIVVLMEKAEGAASGDVNSASASGGAAGAPNTQRINCLSEALGKQNAFDLTDVHLKDQFLQVYPPARMLVNSLAATAKLIRTVVEDVSWTRVIYLFMPSLVKKDDYNQLHKEGMRTIYIYRVAIQPNSYSNLIIG
uniref:WASH-7_mid domain-containing protein n=1 Tax=Rodentolepis nana TaxID=102285 RepID=A0A0R3T4I9_RODNA